jgi:uncharacterized protein with HEPN domain
VSLKPWQERVEHILDAIAEIEVFLAGMGRDEFLADAKTLKAATANLTIIGEAARHIPDAVVQSSPHIPWPLMRGMRNRIVHGYYQVDPPGAQNEAALPAKCSLAGPRTFVA